MLLIDFSAFVAALMPIVTLGLGLVLSTIVLALLARPFREWLEK